MACQETLPPITNFRFSLLSLPLFPYRVMLIYSRVFFPLKCITKYYSCTGCFFLTATVWEYPSYRETVLKTISFFQQFWNRKRNEIPGSKSRILFIISNKHTDVSGSLLIQWSVLTVSLICSFISYVSYPMYVCIAKISVLNKFWHNHSLFHTMEKTARY